MSLTLEKIREAKRILEKTGIPIIGSVRVRAADGGMIEAYDESGRVVAVMTLMQFNLIRFGSA